MRFALRSVRWAVGGCGLVPGTLSSVVDVETGCTGRGGMAGRTKALSKTARQWDQPIRTRNSNVIDGETGQT